MQVAEVGCKVGLRCMHVRNSASRTPFSEWIIKANGERCNFFLLHSQNPMHGAQSRLPFLIEMALSLMGADILGAHDKRPGR